LLYSDDSITIMIIPIIIIIAALLNEGHSLQCYYCQDFSAEGAWTYDANCSENGYDGHVYDGDYGEITYCRTDIYSNGMVSRGLHTGDDSGSCLENHDTHGEYVSCFCQDELCNNDLCSECGGFTTTDVSTPGSTPLWTTTSPSVTTMPASVTTQPMESSTTTQPGDTTTKQPSEDLQCYTCVNCPTVGDNTALVSDPEYNTCFTMMFLDGNTVYRGGSTVVEEDGHCIMQTDSMTCFCTHDACNDQHAL
ncbi:unnamed protein product, partial [Meganyctiphanes norvegica]